LNIDTSSDGFLKIKRLILGKMERVERTVSIPWKDRAKVEGRLMCLHARMKVRLGCTDFSGFFKMCPNFVASIQTWTYPRVWFKCKNPKPECLKYDIRLRIGTAIRRKEAEEK